MARFIYDEVEAALPARSGVQIQFVRLWETDTCSATYRKA
jgi:hypothetical protein